MKSSILIIAAYCSILSFLLAAQESEGAKTKKVTEKPPKGNSNDGEDGNAMNPENFGKALMNCVQTGQVDIMTPERVAFSNEMKNSEEARRKFSQCLMKCMDANVNPLKDPKFCTCFDNTMDCASK